MTMSSRERVLAAINHTEPDRVPLDLGGSRITSLHPEPYRQVCRILGIEDDPPRIMDVWQMLVWMEQPAAEQLGADVLPVPRLTQDFGMRIDGWKRWTPANGKTVLMPGNFEPVPEENGDLTLYLHGWPVARKSPSSLYFDRTIEFTVHEHLPAVEEHEMPLFTDEELTWRRHWAETLRSETDKALLGEFGALIGRWGSIQEWLCILAAQPGYVVEFNERKTENLLTNVRLYADAVGDNIDVVWTGEDFGTQRGMLISPAAFREIVAPYYKRLFDWIHSNTSWKVLFHCCGGIYPIIPDLISCGVDILNPVQVEAEGMDAGRLKEEFGQRLTFWGGGVDTQSVMPRGSVEDVRRQVEERVHIFGSGGGFVFAPNHNIQADVPGENVAAMVDALRRCGRYPFDLADTPSR